MSNIVWGPGHLAANGIDLHPMLLTVWARQTRDQELPYIRVSAMDNGLLLTLYPSFFKKKKKIKIKELLHVLNVISFLGASERNR